jgi:hemerythrin superfamily protein
MATERNDSASGSGNSTDAIVALTADHKRVKELFKEFATLKEKRGDKDEEKLELVKRICRELKVHTAVEEQIFYPAVREQIDDGDLMDEALVEHAGAKDLVEQLESMDVEDDLYDAKVTVLGEQIDHHVKEEEGTMFPKAKKAKLDTKALGAEMAQRKSQLQAMLEEEDEEPTNGGARSATASRRTSRQRT